MTTTDQPPQIHSDDARSLFSSMRPVDFARERAIVCGSDIVHNTGALDALLFGLYGNDAEDIDIRQTLKWAEHLRRRMQRSRLLLIKHELMEHSTNAIEEMSGQERAELDELPPMPDETVFGFERPRVFRVGDPHNRYEPRNKVASVIVPFDPAGLLFTGTDVGTSYTGYARLVDQEAIWRDTDEDHLVEGKPLPGSDARSGLAAFRQRRQLWVPSMVNEMQVSDDQVSMDRLLRLALHRAAEGASTTIPGKMQRTAESAGVTRRWGRTVHTVELSPDAPQLRTSPSDPTGRTIHCEFEVGTDWRYITDEDGRQVRQYGHWRRFRDADGTEIKRVFVKRYTKGEGKPRKPDTEAVIVAREPKQDPDTPTP